MNRAEMLERYRWTLPILLLAFLLRIAYLDAQSLWWDEAFSVTISSMDLRSLLTAVLDDRVHPPLYYLALHIWLILGQGEFVLRALSAFLGVLGVACIFPMAAVVGGKRLGTVSAFALAISPMHIWYSQEARMYSLAVFLTVLANYFFVRLLTSDTRAAWLGYGIATLLAMHTHYLALFVVLAQMTYLTVTRRHYRSMLRKWFVCMAVVGLLSVPWFGTIFLTGGFYQASISWIRPAAPPDLFWTIYDFGLGSSSDPSNPANILLALLMTALLAYVTWRLLRAKAPPRLRGMLWFVWLWLLLPVFLVLLISLDWPLPQKRSIYMDRFLISSLPAFLILISYGITQIFKWQRVLGAVLATALLVAVAGSVYAEFSDPTYQRDDWRQAIEYVRRHAHAGDILLARPHHHVPLYYYHAQDLTWFTVPYLESPQDYEAFLDAHLPNRLEEGGKLWIMVVCENADPHRFVQSRPEDLQDKVRQDEVLAWVVANYGLLSEQTYVGVYLASFGTQPDQASPRDFDGSFVLLTEDSRYPILRHDRDEA